MNNISSPFIDVDDYKGGIIAAQHLLSFGHKKIGYIDGPDMICCHARKAGLCDTLKEAGLELYAEAKGDLFDYSVGYNAIKEWENEDRIPTAVFACCDSVATGAIEALRRRKYNVPDDVSVMGFDNIPLFRDYEIKLTTIEQPVELLCANAVDMIIHLLEGKALKNEAIKLEPNLIPGNSTGPCRVE
jgi:LacI family transcriptional regulator